MIETVYVEDKENIEITTIGTTVNDGHLREMIGRYGLGERNRRMLIEFCVQNNLSMANSNYKHHKPMLYTITRNL